MARPAEPVTAFSAGFLRLELVRRDDRFAHKIFYGDSPTPWLASIEGDAHQVWPPSPPLQELHVERSAAGHPLALLVGMAGRSHWSLSIEIDAAEQRLTIEAACRAHQAPELLASSYRWLADQSLPPREQTGAAPILLGPLVIKPAVALECATHARFDEQGIALTPTNVGSSFPATIRWRYVVRVA